MAGIQAKLLMLSEIYDRHPYEEDGEVGFGDRGLYPIEMFSTIEEALEHEAKKIRKKVADNHNQAVALESQINIMLVHLGILEH